MPSTTQILYAAGMFYGVRAFLQSIFTFKFSKGYYWNSPGLPSLVVPYGEQSDFYYSGHCGFMVLMLCEFSTLKFRTPALLFWLLVLIYVAFVLLLFKVHYTIGKKNLRILKIF